MGIFFKESKAIVKRGLNHGRSYEVNIILENDKCKSEPDSRSDSESESESEYKLSVQNVT